MATNLVRYANENEIRWGVALPGGIAPLAGDYALPPQLPGHARSA